MRASLTGRLLSSGYLALFFAYLFGPLAIMGVSAFNSSTFPRMSPWECFTTEWFTKLANDNRLLDGLANSLVIGLGVVVLATPIGLAAALWLAQINERFRATFYTIFIAPILFPGVVLGISTLVFWDRLGTAFDAGYDSAFYNGIFLTILGQVTFISAYSMLVFLARLQRFDMTLTEAALDMGATPAQAFRKILLPFLKPAIISAAVLAFLASLENYNTTVFTIVSESTFTTVLASKVRYGIDPSISAVAVVIVSLTLIGALVHESWLGRQDTASRLMQVPAIRAATHPAAMTLILFALVGGAFWVASNQDPAACKAGILEEKRQLQESLRQERLAPKATTTGPAVIAPKPDSGFGNVFDPGNLNDTGPADAGTGRSGSEAPAAPSAPRPSTGFGDVFDPGNLNEAGPDDTAPAAPSAPKPSTGFGDVFDPGNLNSEQN